MFNKYQKIIFVFLVFFGVVFSPFFSSAKHLKDGQVCSIDSDCANGVCIFDNSVTPPVKRCAPTSSPSAGVVISPPTSTATFEGFACNVTEFIAKDIVPPIAVLMTLIIGFLYLISGGDPQKVRTANKVLVFTLLGVILALISPAVVTLVSEIFVLDGGGTITCSGGVSSTIIRDALLNLINWFAWFVAVVAVAFGLYSGFLYMTAQGDAQKVQKATKTFIFAIIGIAVAILAFSIISIVEIFL